MPGNNRSIGGQGLEQGGPNLGNDISRNISREVQADDTQAEVVKNKDKNKDAQASQNNEELADQQQLGETDEAIDE
jgi:hypothetical protein